MTDKVLLCAVGDIHPDRENPDEVFDLARPILREADITFGHLEGTYTEKGTLQIHRLGGVRVHPRNLLSIKNAGFNIVSYAGNHNMDYGNEAFLDTIERTREKGIAVIGAGKDLDEARKPVILDIKGTRVGFLDRLSILIPGYQADVGKPGNAPLRVTTLYEHFDKDQPGSPPKIHTLPNDEDVQDIIDDIKKLRPKVDVLVWSCHWGVHFSPTVADYQIKVGHMVIDAGADLILGHHPHVVHAVEVYKGKAIFYSMGNFAFDSRWVDERLPLRSVRRMDNWHRQMIKLYGLEVGDPEYPTYQFPAISRKTMIVKCFIEGKKIQKVTLVPALVNKRGQPEPLSARSKSGDEIVKFLEERSKDFNTRLPVDDGEAVVIK